MVSGRTRKISIVLLALAGLSAFGLWGWRTGQFAFWLDEFFLKKWLREKIETALIPLRPKLPFEIVSWDYTAEAKDLRRGRISEVRVVLRKNLETVNLKGPLELDWISAGKNWVAAFRPAVTTEGPWKFDGPPVELSIAASQNLDRLIRIGWNSNEFNLENTTLGLKLTQSKLEAGFVGDSIYLTFSNAAGSWTSPQQPTHASEWTALRIGTEVDFSLPPHLKIGDPVPIELGLGSVALAWDAVFFENKIPLTARLSFHGNALEPSARSQMVFEMPSANSAGTVAMGSTLSVTADLGPGFEPNRVDWKLSPISIPLLLKTFAGIPEVSAATSNWNFSEGKIGTQGTFQFPPPELHAHVHTPAKTGLSRALSGSVQLENVSLEDASKSIAAKGVSLELTQSPSGETDVAFEVKKGYFLQFPWKIPGWKFKIAAAQVDGTRTLSTLTPLDLPVSGLPIRLEPIAGVIHTAHQPRFEVHSGLHTSSIPFDVLAQGLCKKPRLFPPGSFVIRFPKLDFVPDEISTNGLVEADFFSGKIQLTDITIYDYLTSTPESDFSVSWTGIRLSDLGNWIGFGEMDGTLEGHAEDITLLRTYPTQFDFKIEAKPLNHSDVVFSPDAMKNTVQLFASEQLDQLPGIAKWLAFGWPSRVFGGYDVDYAGISIYSHEGSILVETLDPEAALKRDGRHYIIYGKRFRMPLQTYSYPLVVDATAMGNFVRHIGEQLHALAEAKHKDPSHPTPAPSVSPEETHEPSCLVPENF